MSLGLTLAGELEDNYFVSQLPALKNALSVRLSCTAPACVMTLRLSAARAPPSQPTPAGVLFSIGLTIPNNGPGNPSATVAQVNAAANVLAATPIATLSTQLTTDTGVQVNVFSISSVSVVAGVLVPLVVAPPKHCGYT